MHDQRVQPPAPSRKDDWGQVTPAKRPSRLLRCTSCLNRPTRVLFPGDFYQVLEYKKGLKSAQNNTLPLPFFSLKLFSQGVIFPPLRNFVQMHTESLVKILKTGSFGLKLKILGTPSHPISHRNSFLRIRKMRPAFFFNI